MTHSLKSVRPKISIKTLSSAIAVATGLAGVSVPHIAQAALLEEVVVTAQRKETSLLDTPVAVTAFSKEGLKAAGVDDISDLNAANPSFMATPFLSDPMGNAPVRIRGIGTGGGNPGFEGAVGLYVDEVYRSRTGSALLTFFDMEGVEILRGPQGTLFGKNTTAGALLQKTAAPVIDETLVSLSAEGGNYGSQRYEGMVNLPISEVAAIRIAGLHEELDGWFENPVTGEDTFWRENQALRASLAFEPTDDFSGKVVLDWSTMDSPGNYGTSTRLNNQAGDPLQDFASLFALNAASPPAPFPLPPGGLGDWYWDADGSDFDPYDRDIRNSQNGEYELEQKGFTMHLNYDLNDSVSVRSITGYRKIESASLNGDWDFGPVDVGGGLDQVYDFDTFSQEFIISGETDSLEYVAGFNYFHEEAGYDRRARSGDQFGAWLATLTDGAYQGALGPGTGVAQFGSCTLDPASPFCLDLTDFLVGNNTDFNFQDLLFDQTEDSYGIFGHVTYHINEKLSLIGGLRYNIIEKSIDVDNRAGANQDEYHDLARDNIYGFYALFGAGLASPDWDADREDKEWTYNATVQYRPTDDIQLYFSYSRGFKSGGFNMNENAPNGQPSYIDLVVAQGAAIGAGILPGDPAFPTRGFGSGVDNREFDPEYVDAFELGFRWDISGRGRISATLFHSDYDDLQVATFTGLTFLVANAGSSTTHGLELEGEFAATDNLTLNAGATFLKARYGDDVDFLPAGRRRGQTPDESIVVGARYNKPINETIEFYANGNYTYQGEMFLAEGEEGEALADLKQDSYTIANASLGIRIDEHWDLGLFCNNCFDEDYYEWGFNQPFFSALMVNPAPPMTWGARVSYDFF